MKITQRRCEHFKDSVEDLISRYREEFSVPVVTDWRDYEFFYKWRMKGMGLELRSMVGNASSMVVDEFGRHPRSMPWRRSS